MIDRFERETGYKGTTVSASYLTTGYLVIPNRYLDVRHKGERFLVELDELQMQAALLANSQDGVLHCEMSRVGDFDERSPVDSQLKAAVYFCLDEAAEGILCQLDHRSIEFTEFEGWPAFGWTPLEKLHCGRRFLD